MAPRQRVDQQPGYVLHTYPYRETSLIVEAFSLDHGRVGLVARGARRPTSQLRGQLMAFRPLFLDWSGGGEMKTLIRAEWQGRLPLLGGQALLCGYYLNELLMRLLARHDPHPRLFDAYAASMPALAQGEDLLVQAGLRAFELVLLREIGVLPALDQDTVAQAPLRPQRHYALRPELGLSADGPADARLPAAWWTALEAALAAGEMASLQRHCADSLPALKSSLRAVLHYHLGSPKMRTREVMLDARQWSSRAAQAAAAPAALSVPPLDP